MGGPVCAQCGLRPAAKVTLHRHVGMLVLQKFFWVEVALCREHGNKMASDFLKKTLVQGWWGLISFFVNFFCVAADLNALTRFARLGAPGSVPSPKGIQVVGGSYTCGNADCQIGVDQPNGMLFLIVDGKPDVTIRRGEISGASLQPGAVLELATAQGAFAIRVTKRSKKVSKLEAVYAYANSLRSATPTGATRPDAPAVKPRRPVRRGHLVCPNDHPTPDGSRFCGVCGSELVAKD